MALSGGSGTLTPADGEHVARVIPLRRRGIATLEPPMAREPLQAENAAFDPELEPTRITLRKRPTRRLMAPFAFLLPGRVTAVTLSVAVLSAAALVATAIVVTAPSARPVSRPDALARAEGGASVETAPAARPGAVRIERHLATAAEPARSGRRSSRHLYRSRVRASHRANRVAAGHADQQQLTPPSDPTVSATPPVTDTPTVATAAPASQAPASSSSSEAQSASAFGAAGVLGPGSSPNG